MSIPPPRIGIRWKTVLDFGKITKAFDRAATRVLKKMGGFVKTVARRSIRKVSRPRVKGKAPRGRRPRATTSSARRMQRHSRPGQPPKTPTGFIKQTILFSVNARRRSVIVGALSLGGLRDTPETLEFGGTVVRKIRSGRSRQRRKTIRSKIAARPYMGPALETSLPQFPKLWANSIRR